MTARREAALDAPVHGERPHYASETRLLFVGTQRPRARQEAGLVGVQGLHKRVSLHPFKLRSVCVLLRLFSAVASGRSCCFTARRPPPLLGDLSNRTGPPSSLIYLSRPALKYHLYFCNLINIYIELYFDNCDLNMYTVIEFKIFEILFTYFFYKM